MGLRKLLWAFVLSQLLISTGCTVVTFDNHLPDRYLDRSECFVGTITSNTISEETGKKSSSVLFLQSPDHTGARSITTVSNRFDVTTQKKDTNLTQFQIYNVNGLRYFFITLKKNRAYIPLKVDVDGQVVSITMPTPSQFSKYWPREYDSQKPSFQISSSPEYMARILGNKELSELLFKNPEMIATLDCQKNILSVADGKGKIVEKSKEGDFEIAMLLPGSLPRTSLTTGFGVPFFLSGLLMVFVTSRVILSGYRFQTNQPPKFTPLVFGWAATGAIGVWICLSVMGMISSISLDLFSYLPLLFLLLFVCGVGAIFIPILEGWIWQKIISFREGAPLRNILESMEPKIAHVKHRDVYLFSIIIGGITAFVAWIGFFVLHFSTALFSFEAIFYLWMISTLGSVLTTWVVFGNETLVFLASNSFRWRTLKRSAGPALIAVAMLSPGFLATSWVQSKVHYWIDAGLTNDLQVAVPGFEGSRPVIREPRMEDGLLPFFLGIPQVEVVQWSTSEQKFSLRAPSMWRTSIMYALSVASTITTLFFLLLLVRLLISILLRVASTDSAQPIIYRPVA